MLNYLVNKIKNIIDNDSIRVESSSNKYPDMYEIWVRLDLQQRKIYDIYDIYDKINDKIKTIDKSVYKSGEGDYLCLTFDKKILQRKFKLNEICN